MMIMMNAMSKVVQLVITTDLFLSNTVISSFPKLFSRTPFWSWSTNQEGPTSATVASHSISTLIFINRADTLHHLLKKKKFENFWQKMNFIANIT